MIREAIAQLVAGHSLSVQEAAQVMQEMMDGEATPAQMGAFLTALRIKGETAEEIAGMASVMRQRALKVESEGLLVDTCGTGGDGKGTFNISTAAAFVVAGAGLQVAKHGNRAASGACGSADVLEALGVKLELSPEGVQRCLEEVGIGFMFAPTFHPAMQHAAPVRRELGMPTVFNLLGPLTNPAGAQVQLVGVASAAVGEKLARVLNLLDTYRAWVVHGEDGLDEMSLSAPTQVWEVKEQRVESFTVDPENAGLHRAPLSELKGGSAEENAATLRGLLQGKRGPLRDVVLLNTAAVLVAAERADDLRQGVQLAAEVIDSGEALQRLEKLVELSRTLR